MITYSLATSQDDADLRALLRHNGMPSWVDMTLEREPSFFSEPGLFGTEYAVVARCEGSPVGMFTCTRQWLHVNGAPRPVAYLAGLRVDRGWRGRIRVLRGGFDSMPRLVPLDALCITSVASDNLPARRLLEAGVKGLPSYGFLGELATLALARPRRGQSAGWAAPREVDELVEFYNRHARNFQLAPVLDPDTVTRVGLSNFRVLRQGGHTQACGAWWNQQGVRQVVARRYAPWVRALRPAYNLYAHLAGRVILPPVGQPLNQSFLAFLAFSPAVRPGRLIRELLAHCPTPVGVVGVPAAEPLYAELKPRASFTYLTRIYTVSFGPEVALDERPLRPEAAVL